MACGLLALTIGVRAVSSATHARWLPTAVIILFAIACSFPGSRFIDWAVWLPTLGLDWWSQKRLVDIKLRSQPAARPEPEIEQPLQQLTRYRTADGSEAIRGTLVAEFEAGDRSATVYAAFCPPFEQLPDVEAQVGDDSPAVVKVTQHLHNGVQFEVRLPHAAASPQYVTIEFFASNNASTN
jgi:hypothetical protein